MKALRRWIATEGAMGAVPQWYLLVRAARYLKVPPWDLATKPVWWMNVALAAEQAENTKTKKKVGDSADGG